MTVTKTVRGKRPSFFDQPGVDYLMAMTTALIQEVAVLRDRVDLIERVADSKGIVLNDDVEGFELDEAALMEREAWRNAYMSRIFAVFEQEQAELAAKETRKSYQATLDEVARG
ncbi:MAG: hypothetical protein Hens3KO_29190 [Henriciella sp.]